MTLVPRQGADVRKVVLLLGCFAASPLAAGETKLTGEVMKTTLNGSLLELDTPIGTTVSVRLNYDGMMTGEAGALAPVLGAAKDRGRWWVVDDHACFKWFRWFDAEPRCVSIALDGKRFSWRKDDGDTGTGTIVEQGKPVSKPVTVVAQAAKPAAQPEKPAPKKAVVVASADGTKMQDRLPVSPAEPSSAGAATVESPSSVSPVALHVPAPRPAARPKPRAEFAVAAVKPQFFAAPKAEQKIEHKPFRVAGVDPADVLNIRNGPSFDYDSVGGIPSDSRGITITGPCLNDWCPVKHRSLAGWVNRRYLAEEVEPASSTISDRNYSELAP
jgi:hypothetical protein